MAELIGALAEAIAGLVLIIAEALPAIAELLIYLVIGSATLIAYALSRGFRERKRREWTERPRRRHLDIGFSAVSLTMLALLALWIFLPSAKPSKGPVHSTAAPAQSDANFELMIGKRSDQDSNRVNNAGPPEEGSAFEIAAKEVARETKCDGSGSSGRRCGSNE